MNDFLCKRINGIYGQSVIDGIQGSYDSTYELINYLHDLSIDSATEKDIEEIGKLIGYLRPYVPDEFLNENKFVFFNATGGPIFSTAHGFSSLAHPEIGGRFTSVSSKITKLPIDIYKSVLKKVAYIKYNGLSIASIDKLVSLAGVDYTITYNTYHDIVVSVESTISIIYIYVFSQVFSLFASQPQIILQEF